MAPRSERAYLLLAGIFIAALVACNLLVYKFFSLTIPAWIPLLGGLTFYGLSVGILPYPLTFLVTDILSEIWGKQRANWVVAVGFVVSLLVVLFVQLGAATHALEGRGWYGPKLRWPPEAAIRWEHPLTLTLTERGADGGGRRYVLAPPAGRVSFTDPGAFLAALRTAWQRAGGDGRLGFSWAEVWRDDLHEKTGELRLRIDYHGRAEPRLSLAGSPELAPVLPAAAELPPLVLPASPVGDDLFRRVFGGTLRAIIASMIAYLCAQWFDIQVFHFWKRLTGGRHLWLRNNGSTILSQLLDTTLVVTILFAGTANGPRIPAMILAGWKFKALVALLDTPFFYAAVFLCRRLRLAPPWSEYHVPEPDPPDAGPPAP